MPFNGMSGQNGPESHFPWYGDGLSHRHLRGLAFVDCKGSGRQMKHLQSSRQTSIERAMRSDTIALCDVGYGKNSQGRDNSPPRCLRE